VYSSGVPVHLVQHPIAQDALIWLRDKETGSSEFRRLTHRLSLVVAMEATRKLPMNLARVDTPLEMTQGEVIETDVVVVPVLRAGLGMVDACLELLPMARVGHIGHSWGGYEAAFLPTRTRIFAAGVAGGAAGFTTASGAFAFGAPLGHQFAV